MTLTMKEILSAVEWEEFVLAHASQALFQSWSWGEVAKKLGQTLWRLGWYEGSTLVAIGQVVKVSALRGKFLHLRHGPILSKPTYWSEILKDIQVLGKREKALFIRVSPQLSDSSENKQLFKHMGFVPAPIHAMDAELCWVLDLEKSEEELLAGMRKTTRYEIKHGVATVTKSKDIDKFFDLYKKTSRRHNFVEHRGIREEFETLDTDLFLGTVGDTVVAAAIIVYFGNEAIYHHGASIPNKAGVSYLIQWEAIREAKRRGKKVYNFWGIAPEDNPNHPWRGITVFKTGFGGRLVSYLHAQDYPVSPLYIIPKTIEHVRRRLKGY